MTSNLTNRELRTALQNLGACAQASRDVGKLDGRAAWEGSKCADHLLWIAARVGVDRQLLARAAAKCAETVLEFVPSGEDRPRLAIDAVLRWANDPTNENLEAVRVTRRNAYAAAAYTAAAAAYAAATAATAADAADAAAYAVAYAADAAAYTGRTARAAQLARCAVIVREIISFDAVLTAYRAWRS